MSNIDVQNMKSGLDRKIYKVLGMSIKNYMGTYDFIVRQTINYVKNITVKTLIKLLPLFPIQKATILTMLKEKNKIKIILGLAIDAYS